MVARNCNHFFFQVRSLITDHQITDFTEQAFQWSIDHCAAPNTEIYHATYLAFLARIHRDLV